MKRIWKFFLDCFKPTSETEYSKIWITRWQNYVMVWCSVFFIADIIFNGAAHSVELCTTLVISIAAVFVPYLAKSYFGKKNEELLKSQKEPIGEENAEYTEDDLK